MGLEVAIAENAAALEEVATLLKENNAGREAAIAKITETPAKPARATRATVAAAGETAPAAVKVAEKAPPSKPRRRRLSTTCAASRRRSSVGRLIMLTLSDVSRSEDRDPKPNLRCSANQACFIGEANC